MDADRYLLYFDYSALALLFILLIHFYMKRNIKTRQNTIFSYIVISTFIATVFDILSVYFIRNNEAAGFSVAVLFTNLFLFTFHSIPVFLLYYIMVTTGSFEKNIRLSRIKLYLPYIAAVFLIVMSTATGWIYSIKGEYYYNGSLHFTLYFITLLYGGLIIYEIFRYRKTFKSVQLISLLIFIVMAIVASAIQILRSDIIVMQFFVSLSILVLYIGIENPEGFEDKKLSVFNYNAFRQLVMMSIDKDNHLHIIMIRLNDFRFINNVLGLRNGDELLRQISDFLNHIGRKRFVACRISGVQFALVQKYPVKQGSDAILEETLDKIKERFRSPFLVNDMSVSISTNVYKLSYPDDVNSIEDIFATTDFLINEIKAENFDELMLRKMRENQVIQIMKEALDNNRFEVYYQLIFDHEKKRFISAEALVRLFDDNIGFISPEEFVPLAERNGMIIAIGDFVLNEVCKFIKDHDLRSKGIEYIEVNLSALQCMQREWHEKLLNIVDSYGIPHDMFNFEITESVDVISEEILKDSMNELIKNGFSFSLDDYGTGFSNSSYITTFPYEIVKIDKKLVWDAVENEKAMILLKNTINMLNEMKLKMVAEGVEDKETEELLVSLGCNQFQGYLHARPLPVKQVLKKLEESF
ncbi:MAG: GGDEF domain-containing phosphodiesterase [Lachnospiraceae bacterium]|nr:GGDEF domain-containing phosphodiesterase [Lachnospiraceae bacterium]